MVLRFISYLNRYHLSISTIRVYLSGVRAWVIAQGGPPLALFSPRVKWALKSILRGQPPPRRVTPFTFEMLEAVYHVLVQTHDQLVIWVAMLVGYFACLRSSEYCPDTRVSRPILPSDITLYSHPVRYLSMFISSSKTSPAGFTVIIGCSGTHICAYCWLSHLISTRAHLPSHPIFTLSDGHLLTARHLTAAMRRLVSLAGLPPAGITPHSLRAGSATDAAGLGASDARVKALGRWTSNAYQLYLRPGPRAQASTAAWLASGQNS